MRPRSSGLHHEKTGLGHRCTWAAVAQYPTSLATHHEQEHLGRCWPVETTHPPLIHPQVIRAVVGWEAQQEPGMQVLGFQQGPGRQHPCVG